MKPYTTRDSVEDIITELSRSGLVVFDTKGDIIAKAIEAAPASIDARVASTKTHYHDEWQFIYDGRRFSGPQDKALLHLIHMIDAVFSER